MLGLIHGNDPFLVYPQVQAWKCPTTSCLNLPEEQPPTPVRLTWTRLDSLTFFPRGIVAASPAPLPRRPRDSSNLELKGVKTIRTSLGEGGLLVQQEMVLDVKGEPTPGLMVQAHLTDRDAPLSSTGSTTSLRQTDEIWIDARSRRFHSRIGDQTWTAPGGLLGSDTRNGRGLLVELGDSSLQTWGGFAAGRSIWQRQEIQGISGIQEGYALSLGSNQPSVVAGSEKVWLDGKRLQRHVDYEFHSADGILDFTPSRRILSSTRIVVEYQAADQDYERSLFTGGAGFGGRNQQWKAWILKEGDDPNAPLSYVADSTTRRILSQAGADSLLLRTDSGIEISAPESRLRTGLTGRWNGWNTGALDLRWTQLDPNAASTKDAQPSGTALSFENHLQHGRFWNRGGIGRFHLSTKFTGWQKGYLPLRPAQPDTQQTGGWIPPEIRSTHDQESGSLQWEALPSLGLWSNAQHFRLEDWADLKSASLSAGLSRDSSRQILAQQTIAELDQGSRFHRQATRLDLAWVFSRWEPSLRSQMGTREDPHGVDRNRIRWQEVLGGLTYRESWWHATATVRTRSDQSRFGATRLIDSASTLQSSVQAEVQTSQWTGTALLDRLSTQTRSAPEEASLPATNWLAQVKSLWIPSPTGFRLEGQYRLSTSQWRASLPLYDTVPSGTGKFRYDSANGEVVPDEFGNLLLVGTRLDSLRPAQQSGNVLLSLSTTIIPRELAPSLKGLLADLGEQFSLELEQIDSSQSRLLPAWEDQKLGHSILGRSSLSNRLWWERKRIRIELESERNFRNSIQNWSYEKDQDVVWSQKPSIAIQYSDIISISSEAGLSKRRHLWSGINDRFEKWWISPGLKAQWLRIDGEAAILWQAGEKNAQTEAAQRMTLFSQSLQVGWRPSPSLRLWSNLRHLEIQSETDLGTWLSEGYPPGSSWRSQTGAEWAIKESLQASADWVVRLLPNLPLEQKLNFQARAVF